MQATVGNIGAAETSDQKFAMFSFTFSCFPSHVNSLSTRSKNVFQQIHMASQTLFSYRFPASNYMSRRATAMQLQCLLMYYTLQSISLNRQMFLTITKILYNNQNIHYHIHEQCMPQHRLSLAPQLKHRTISCQPYLHKANREVCVQPWYSARILKSNPCSNTF